MIVFTSAVRPVLTRIAFVIVGSLLLSAVATATLVSIATGLSDQPWTHYVVAVAYMCFFLPVQFMLVSGLAILQLCKGHLAPLGVRRSYSKTVILMTLLYGPIFLGGVLLAPVVIYSLEGFAVWCSITILLYTVVALGVSPERPRRL